MHYMQHTMWDTLGLDNNDLSYIIRQYWPCA